MTRRLKVLELFAGTRSVSKAFEEHGHDTYSVELDHRHPNIDLYADVGQLQADTIREQFGEPDVVWASPPCTTYSVAGIHYHRRLGDKGYPEPISEFAKDSDVLVQHTKRLISDLDPEYFFIENPRGALRKMPFMQDMPRYTISYCLAGETKIITRNGSIPIAELEGKSVELLTKGGLWIEAPIRCYGIQPLLKITLSRAKKVKTIYATSNHRWFVNGRIVETDKLKPGYRLDYVKTERKDCHIIPEYVARGITFGDGFLMPSRKYSAVSLYNEKRELINYFDGFGGKRNYCPTNGCETIRMGYLPSEWKIEVPNPNDDPSKIFSWIAGYLASDGYVNSNNGQIQLSSSVLDNMEVVRTLCESIGIGTYSIVVHWRLGYGKEPTPLYILTLMRSDVPEEMILRSKHKEAFNKAGRPKSQPRRWTVLSVEPTDRVEPVYCADVPETHSFALEDNILTHNCQYGDFRQKPTDIWTDHPDPRFKPLCKPGAPCHQAAPRGSRTGTQGLPDAKERSRIPPGFCEHIVEISEEPKDMERPKRIYSDVPKVRSIASFQRKPRKWGLFGWRTKKGNKNRMMER